MTPLASPLTVCAFAAMVTARAPDLFEFLGLGLASRLRFALRYGRLAVDGCFGCFRRRRFSRWCLNGLGRGSGRRSSLFCGLHLRFGICFGGGRSSWRFNRRRYDRTSLEAEAQ